MQKYCLKVDLSEQFTYSFTEHVLLSAYYVPKLEPDARHTVFTLIKTGVLSAPRNSHFRVGRL